MVCWYLVFELHEKNDLPIYIYIYTLGNLLNNVCCENKNIKNKFLNKRYFATYVAFSSSHGGLYIYSCKYVLSSSVHKYRYIRKIYIDNLKVYIMFCLYLYLYTHPM